jgi:hypothetical protein
MELNVGPRCYILNVDADGPDGNGKWDLSAVVTLVRDTEGAVLAASCWYRLVLKNSDTAQGVAVTLGLKFAKDLYRGKHLISSYNNVVFSHVC